MSLLDDLKGIGCDIDDGLNRFMQNASLYEKMLRKFPESLAKVNLVKDFSDHNVENAISEAHTIKGVTGNLSITPLYVSYTEIVKLLREGNMDAAKAEYEKILPVQEKVLSILTS